MAAKKDMEDIGNIVLSLDGLYGDKQSWATLFIFSASIRSDLQAASVCHCLFTVIIQGFPSQTEACTSENGYPHRFSHGKESKAAHGFLCLNGFKKLSADILNILVIKNNRHIKNNKLIDMTVWTVRDVFIIRA
ncbi:hypothetical protein CHARACLAT_003421 [Characodon lateralis]|uniref:Uncharacterized protein n=1 Tax=Characodon lateralis TaxID=208331 RepID=A0ABU7DN09_9TELE|nr:hypothetical protein [Characodon lateralis]